MTTYTPSTSPYGFTNRYYGPLLFGAQVHPSLIMNGIFPDPDVHGPPARGYPWVMWLGIQGYNQDSLVTSIGDAQVPQQKLLDRGIALIFPLLPVVRDPLTGIDVSDGTFDPGAGEWGTNYPRGNGVHVSFDGGPGDATAWPGAFPTGYAEAFPTRPHPWLDDRWVCSWKATIDAWQHCLYNGQQGTAELMLDMDRGGVFGLSAGAQCATMLLHGDKALLPEYIEQGGQRAMTTRPKVVALANPCMSYIAWKTEEENGGPEAWQMAVAGDDDEWDEAAADLAAASVNNQRLLLSPVYWLQQTAKWPGMEDANRTVKVVSHANVGMAADVLADPNRYTANFGHAGTSTTGETEAHSAYSQYLIMRFFENSHTMVLDSDDMDPDAVAAGAVRQIDEVVSTSDELWEAYVREIMEVIGTPKPADQLIAEKLAATLEGITHANGYATDVKAVYRFEKLPAQLPEAPAICWRTDRTRRSDKDAAGFKEKWLTVVLQLIITGWDSHEERISAFEADVEQILDADCTLGGLAFNVTVGDSERFLADEGTNKEAWSVVSIEVQYRHELTDPYTLIT